jgi:hypothetical protein
MSNPIVIYIIIVGLVYSLAGCGQCPQPEGKHSAMPLPSIRTDAEALHIKITLPDGFRDLKWNESALSESNRFGPTDTRLRISFRLSDTAWQNLIVQLGHPLRRRDFPFDSAWVTVLFTPHANSTLRQEHGHPTFIGDIYNPSPLASIHYVGVAALRVGDQVYLEFTSR